MAPTPHRQSPQEEKPWLRGFSLLSPPSQTRWAASQVWRWCQQKCMHRAWGRAKKNVLDIAIFINVTSNGSYWPQVFNSLQSLADGTSVRVKSGNMTYTVVEVRGPFKMLGQDLSRHKNEDHSNRIYLDKWQLLLCMHGITVFPSILLLWPMHYEDLVNSHSELCIHCVHRI